MTRMILFCLLGTAAGSAFAAKPCDELKAELAAKLDAKHVAGYSLQVVSKSADAPGTVVGTCDGGSKKILYSRRSANADGTTASSETKSASDETKK